MYAYTQIQACGSYIPTAAYDKRQVVDAAFDASMPSSPMTALQLYQLPSLIVPVSEVWVLTVFAINNDPDTNIAATISTRSDRRISSLPEPWPCGRCRG